MVHSASGAKLTLYRTFELTALRLLLEWGAASLEKSINQPSLPHAIVALDMTNPALGENSWEVRTATESLLTSVHSCLDKRYGDPYLCDLANHWEENGRKITCILDLLLCYYSNFQVVPIPAKGRFQRLNDQVQRLHRCIIGARNASFKAKKRARMLSNSDELNTYFQFAFDHFSRTLSTPFNFIKVSLKLNPIPESFGAHILELATVISKRRWRGGPEQLFLRLSDMVASSIMFDWVRHRKGSVQYG